MTTTPEELKSTLETPESISLQEIGFMFQIIQACAQRGAFKPDEFKDVGTLNQKLKSILNYAKELEDAKNKTDETTGEQSNEGTTSAGSEK